MIDFCGRNVELGNLLVMSAGLGKGYVSHCDYALCISEERAFFANKTTRKMNDRNFVIIPEEGRTQEAQAAYDELLVAYRDDEVSKKKRKDSLVKLEPGDIVSMGYRDYSIYLGKVQYRAVNSSNGEEVHGNGHLKLSLQVPYDLYRINNQELKAMFADCFAPDGRSIIKSLQPHLETVINNGDLIKLKGMVDTYNDWIGFVILTTTPAKVVPSSILQHNVLQLPMNRLIQIHSRNKNITAELSRG